MDMKKKRGPKGKGGIRVILHIWPQQLEAIEKILAEGGGSRAELIRRAIDAYIFKKRRETDREANS
jgi:metal-responsive CopG/Arc/MetJ family transcriptional regulator